MKLKFSKIWNKKIQNVCRCSSNSSHRVAQSVKLYCDKVVVIDKIVESSDYHGMGYKTLTTRLFV